MNNSLTELPYIPRWARNYKETVFFIYTGVSMSPLFRPGDLLCAQKVVLENIRLGDILIIDWGSDRKKNEYVVHRVVLVEQEYLISQGDHNLKSDTQVVTIDNLVGLVTLFARQNRIYPVRGGAIGLMYARLIHAWYSIWLFTKRLGWQFYHTLRQSGLAAKIWRPAISRVRVMTDTGPLIKYCMGNRTVARWWPEINKFDVVKPFDLVILNPEESK
jgi:signal peptidase I